MVHLAAYRTQRPQPFPAPVLARDRACGRQVRAGAPAREAGQPGQGLVLRQGQDCAQQGARGSDPRA